MRTIRIDRMLHSTVTVRARTIPLTIGDRQVSLRVRPRNEEVDEPLRLSIFTPNVENLPKPRRVGSPTARVSSPSS